MGPTYGTWAWRECPSKTNFSVYDPQTGLISITNCSNHEPIFESLPTLKGQTGLYMVQYVQDRTTIEKGPGPFFLSTDAAVVTCGEEKNLYLSCKQIPSAIQRVSWRNDTLRTDPKRVPNIVMIFLDALARNAFYRKLPKTMKLLEDVHNNPTLYGSEMFQFMQYHSLARTTRKNGRAMFTGNWSANHYKTVWEILQESYITGIIDNTCMEWSAKYFSHWLFKTISDICMAALLSLIIG